MAPTSTAIRNAKPQAKPYMPTDEKRLFLLVQPSGGILWRFKFRIDVRDDAGKPKRIEKKLGLGMYPDMSLNEPATCATKPEISFPRGSTRRNRSAATIAQIS